MHKIGIVGTGWGARVQVPAFREAGLDVAGIAGFHHNKTARLAGELSVQAYDQWPALIASDVDVVSIVTPPSEHLEMAKAALAAGKHVISEKPTALNAGESLQLVEAARAHPDRIAIIDHELRFLPAWRAARERIGEIGALRYIEVRYASPSRGDRAREWNWWSDAERGGGIWGAVGSHSVDTIRYLGFEIARAQATLETVIGERPYGESAKKVTSDDLAVVNLELKPGGTAFLSFSAVAAGPDEPAVMTIHGEEGAMRLVGEELLFARRGESFIRIAGGDLQKRAGNSPGGAFGSGTVLLGKALKAALDGDGSALAVAATFDDGLAQQRVLDAARRSSVKDGRWVEILS
jgi:predicted dehydrogenase